MMLTVQHIPLRRCLLIPTLLWLFPALVYGQGYEIRGNRIIVERGAQWRQWNFPNGTIDVSDAGLVKPTFIRKNVNASLDARAFNGGIRRAGSNPDHASRIIDGDPKTFWEPNPNDPLSDWWVEVDLGRVVSATQVVVRFAENGDPFRQFKVLTSDGMPAFFGSKTLKFSLIGGTTRPVETEKVFAYQPTPKESATENWTGDAIRYIRIQATNREKDLHPRLSEVEVWTVGDNVTLEVVKRGGSISFLAGLGRASDVSDGDINTSWRALVFTPLTPQGEMTVDLGTSYWINSCRIVSKYPPGETHGVYLLGYSIRGSDGSLAPDGSLVWQALSPKSREDNKDRRLYMEDDFEIRKLRYIVFRHIDPTGSITGFASGYNTQAIIAEFQIFGEGYIPDIEITSEPIDLGSVKNMVSIEWDAETPSGTGVEIQTRTGDTMKETTHFYDKGGKEVSEREYRKLPSFMQGGEKVIQVPSSDWSNWSRPYMKPGDRMTSPSPRKFMMIKARLLSDTPDRFATLRSIRVNFVQPVAKRLTGELGLIAGDGVYSRPEVQPGTLHKFSFFITPTFASGDKGFDQIILKGPDGITMELQGLKLGGSEITLHDVKVMTTQRDSLWIRLPRVVKSGEQIPVEVQFGTRVFRDGSLFLAWVGNSSTQDSWQSVDPGNATDLVDGNTAIASMGVTNDVLGKISVEPEIITPNGDGLNDIAMIRFAVLKMNLQRVVTVTVYDLSGRSVKDWGNVGRSVTSGMYEITWKGEDNEGRRVTPGLYTCQISVEADTGEETAVRSIAVAY